MKDVRMNTQFFINKFLVFWATSPVCLCVYMYTYIQILVLSLINTKKLLRWSEQRTLKKEVLAVLPEEL